jgi:hypothetical protein
MTTSTAWKNPPETFRIAHSGRETFWSMLAMSPPPPPVVMYVTPSISKRSYPWI